MTVGELIAALEDFDEDMEVQIGMIQRYGSNFSMNICDNVEEHHINSFYGNGFKAVVLTEGNQTGTVDYDDCYDEDEEDEEEE